MNKNIKQLIGYIIGFVVFWQGVWAAIFLAFIVAGCLYNLNGSESNDNGLLFFLMLAICVFGYSIIRFLILILISNKIIKKSQNPLLLEIYNNISIPAKIFLSLAGLDIVIFIIKSLLTHEWDLFGYVFIYSGAFAFIPILLSAIANVIIQKRIAKSGKL